MKKSKNKVYSIHEPAVYSVSKGKASHPYEYGCKVQFRLTHKQGLIVSTEALHPNVYDEHTFQRSLLQAEKLSGTKVKCAFVNKGYKGHNIPSNECTIFISGSKKGITPALKKALKRSSSIEPHIGHMKSDGKLSVNYFKGSLGDFFIMALIGCSSSRDCMGVCGDHSLVKEVKKLKSRLESIKRHTIHFSLSKSK